MVDIGKLLVFVATGLLVVFIGVFLMFWGMVH